MIASYPYIAAGVTMDVGSENIRPMPMNMREAAMRIMYSAGGLRWGIRTLNRNETTGKVMVRVRSWIPTREGVAVLMAWKRWGRRRMAR